MNEQKIELTLGLVNAILGYMDTRPHGEVRNLIDAIQAQAIPQVPMPEIKPPQEQEQAAPVQ